ncbi:MAG: hypothetical protein JEZ04_02120 [Spirochaetales bacterium]|nr:hypothetical protein [Spirochaetales bacterium]
MKRLLILICIIPVFLSCEDLATRNNLTEEPNAETLVEILDRSKTVSSPTYEAVEYIDIKLSENDWLEYFGTEAELLTPDSYLVDLTLNCVMGTDGKYIIIGYRAARSIQQGDYRIDYLTGDDKGDNETRTYNFNLNVDGIGTDFLGVRDPSNYSPRAPYIFEKESAFTIAIKDDGSTIYVKSNDLTSCEQVYISLFYSDDIDYGIGLGSIVFKLDKWTAIPVSFLEKADYPQPLTAESLRTDSSWNFFAYASTISSLDWGTLWRSETSIVSIIDTVPEEADIIQLPGSRSFSDYGLTMTPLCKEFLNSRL